MDIWLDTTQRLQSSIIEDDTTYLTGECPDDCPKDGDYSSPGIPGPPVASVLAEKNIRYLYDHTFICPEMLYIQRHSDSRWLVCNTAARGGIAVIDEEAYALLTYFQAPKTLQEYIVRTPVPAESAARGVALLTSLGILQDLDHIVPASMPEQAQTLAAWLHITNACNLRCNYCYVQKTSEHMADDTARRAVDAIIRSATRNHYRGIHLTYAGGEATLRLPEVFAVHDYALKRTQEYGLSLSAGMISNGAALPHRAIAQLLERQIRLMISLDGIGEDHDAQRPFLNGKGSFAFVDRTITHLLAGGLVPYINVTVTQHNLNELPHLIRYILQRELPFGLSYYRENEHSTHLSDLQFTDLHMISGMRTAFAFIEHHLPKQSLLSSLVDKANTRAPHQYTCGVGRNYVVVDQHGGVAKCHMDIKHTVTTVDADDPLQAIRAHRQGVQAIAAAEKEGCRTCEWRSWCSGGCPMLTYQLTGRNDIKSPNCAIYKALFPEALRLEALRLLTYESPVTL